MVKRKRRPVPIMLLWSRQEQRRFIDAVERLVAAIGDLESILAEPKRRAKLAAATRKAKEAAKQAVAALGAAEPVHTPPNVDGPSQ